MLGGLNWLRKAVMSLALCAGAVSASTVPPVPAKPWAADPDEQFLLDVDIRQLKLGDGVRAYNAPEGTCVVLGDFLTVLDVPMKVDLAAKTASGWAFKESNRIDIDYAAMTATHAGTREAIAPGTIRETPDGWCVQTSALARWFGIGVKPMTAGSVLLLNPMPSCRSSWRWSVSSAQRTSSPRPSTLRACRRSGFPTGCGERRRWTSWSAPA